MSLNPAMNAIRAITLGLLLLGIQVGPLSAQGWQVIEVGGTVQSEALKRRLKAGDVLPQPTGLHFGGADAYVLLYHPQRGRRLLPPTYRRPAPAGLDGCAKTARMADAQRGTTCLLVDTLAGRLAGGRFLILGEVAAFDLYFEQPLLRNALAEARFWLVVPRGSDSLWIELPFNPDPREPDYLLQLSRQQLAPAGKSGENGQRRGGSAALVLEDFGGERHWIGLLEPVWPDDPSALRQGVQQLIERERKAGRKPADIRRSVERWLAAEYGTPLEQDLRQWLQHTFALSSD